MKNNFKSKLIAAALLVAVTCIAIMPSAGALTYSGQYNGKSYICRGTQYPLTLSASMTYESSVTLKVEASANVRILYRNGKVVDRTFIDSASKKSTSLSYTKSVSDLYPEFTGIGASGYVFTSCTYLFRINSALVETMSV